jgi:hypothetical protein
MFSLLRQWVALQEVQVFDPRRGDDVDPATFYFSGGIVNGARHDADFFGVGIAPGCLFFWASAWVKVVLFVCARALCC